MATNTTPLFAKPNITSFVDLFSYANSVTDDMFMNIGLMGFYLTLFVALNGYTSSKEAFAASSFITTILSFMFATLGLVSEYVVILTALLSALSAFYLIRGK